MDNGRIMLRNLKEALEEMAFDVKRTLQYIMESNVGINDKVDKNTLVDSNIYNELEISTDDWGMISLYVNYYIESIVSGTPPGIWPSVDKITAWAARKGLPTDNDTIYKMCNSIYKWGISPRDVLTPTWDMIDKEFWDKEWADNLFNIMTEELTDFFNN